nr:hypothetical protein Iba_chr12cCG13330 [Ipomoea batatas]
MDMFTRFSYEEVQHNREGDTISYFLHTLHGRRYCIFEMSRQRSQSKYTLAIAQMWLVLMKVMGFQLTFPANINTKRRAEQFLDSFLRGSINFDFGRLGSHLLPEVHGDGVEREPAEDGEAIYDVNDWFDEFCDDQSTLSNFIFWTESEGDSVALRHGTFTLTFINVGELINYAEQYAFLMRMLWSRRRVIKSLVFFNYEVGEVHLIAFNMCGMEIMTEDLYVYNIEDYANVDVGV